ncbi:MAG: UrcA family protein [Erythrobacter sp.]|nr:UrcA family protein [Erythrobacter sp.]
MRFALPLLAFAAVAAPVHATSLASDEVVTVRIAIGDIDLATENGREKFEQRAEARLRKACTIESNSRYGFGRDIVDAKCLAEARTAALAEAERVLATRSRAGGQVAAN